MKFNHALSVLIFAAIIVAGCGKSDQSALYGPPPVNGQGGSLARYAIAGNYLYTVDAENLQTYSLQDPAHPELRSTQKVGFEIETIYPLKDKLFIGSSSVLYIFSLSDPANPQQLSTAVSPNVIRRCDPVVANDTVAYATLRSNGPCGGTQSQLVSIDVRNIEQPVQISSYPVTEPFGLGYADSALYVADGVDGLNVFDIRDPHLLQQVQRIPFTDEYPIDVIPDGNELIVWTSKGLSLFDISVRFQPVLLTKID